MKKYGKKSGEKGFSLPQLKATLQQMQERVIHQPNRSIGYNTLMMLELIEEIERLEESLKTADDLGLIVERLFEDNAGVAIVSMLKADLKRWKKDWANRIMNPENVVILTDENSLTTIGNGSWKEQSSE